MRLKTNRKRGGFTLIEVLVTMGVFSILLPGILMVSLHLTRAAKKGVNRNIAATEGRYLQQFFIQKINASGRNIRVMDDGNIVILELHNDSSGLWEDAALCFLEEENALVYYPPTADGTFACSIPVANPVHRNGNLPIFSPKKDGSVIRCTLYAGKHAPEMIQTIGGWFVTPGVFIDLVASPRNKGRI